MSAYTRKLLCKLLEHRLDGPENDGRILCSRCGAVFDANMLREFEKVLGKPLIARAKDR